MKSHFSLNGGVAVAWPLRGASTILNGNCSHNVIAAGHTHQIPPNAAGGQRGKMADTASDPWSMG